MFFGRKFIFDPKFVGDQNFLTKICLDLKSFWGSESKSGIFEKTRLITMRSKPDYVEFVWDWLLLMLLLLWFLLLKLFIRG